MSKTAWTLVVIAALAVFGALIFYRYRLYIQEQAPVTTATPAPAAPAELPAPVEAPPAHYPVPEESPTEAPQQAHKLPALEDSDESVLASLEQLLGTAAEKLLISKRLVQDIVITIDSLDHVAPAPRRVWPLRAVAGSPVVHADGGSLTLSADNARRYEPYVTVLKAVDAKKLAGLYLQDYSLFQQAYQQLGYPGGYFNDRLIAVIDHLLAAPEADGPIQLVQPKVLYEFADPALEQLSWGQKIMIRIGADNEAAVKAKLSEIRDAIVAKTPAQAATP